MKARKVYTTDEPVDEEQGKKPFELPQSVNCAVVLESDGSAYVTMRVRSDILRRIESRANGMDLDKYIWENILQRALDAHVF